MQRALDEVAHHAGVRAVGDDRGRIVALAPQRKRRLAHRIIRALRDREVRVGVDARPRLDARVDVQHPDVAAQLHERDRRNFDGNVDEKTAGAEKRGQLFAQRFRLSAVCSKRTPANSAMARAESSGSMTVTFERSRSMWRRISGKTPLPIEPKPTTTSGPSSSAKVAWFITSSLIRSSRCGSSLRGEREFVGIGRVEPRRVLVCRGVFAPFRNPVNRRAPAVGEHHEDGPRAHRMLV